jgi:hypothetical protein
MSKNTVKPGLTRRRRNSRTRSHLWVRVVLLVFRFLAGLPLDGRRHSNSTFWRRGTVLGWRRQGNPPYFITYGWWTRAAGWQRTMVRLLLVFLTVLAVRTVWQVIV